MRFDFISFLIGFAVAAAIGFVLYRSRGRIAKVRTSVEQQAGATREFLSNSAEGRFHRAMIERLNQQHIAAELFKLTDVYVEPRFISVPPPEAPGDETDPGVFHVIPQHFDMPASYAPYNVPTLSVNDLGSGERNIALLGGPGAGKSTALAIMGLMAAGEIEIPVIDLMSDPVFEQEIKDLPKEEKEKRIKQRQELQEKAMNQLRNSKSPHDKKAEDIPRETINIQKLLPIFIHLRDLDLRPESYGAAPGKKRALDPAEPLVKALQSRLGGVTASVLPRLVYNRLTMGTALVLIDGYDELPPELSGERLLWLKNFVEIYRANLIIVAGPEVGYQPLLNIGLTPSFLRAWSDSDYKTYVQNWTRAWLILSNDRRSGVSMPEEKIVQRVGNNNRGRSPLDVAFKIWAAYTGDEQEAGRRGWFDFHIRHQMESSGLKDAKPALEKLAVAFLNSGGAPFTREKLKELAGSDDIVNRVTGNPALMVDYLDGRMTFAHAMIASYLASETLNQDNLVEAAGKSAWGLAMPFAAARLNMDSAVSTRLAAPNDMLYSGLFGMVTWVIDAQISATWRSEIFKRLSAALLQPSQFPYIRERAMVALVSTRDKGIIFVMRQALQSTLPQVRKLGCVGLGALGEPDGIRDLATGLTDSDHDVQLAAGLGLSAIGTDTALETMVTALYDSDPGLRRAVAEALAAIPDEGQLTLREAIVAPDMMMRHAAVFGLARIKTAWAYSLLYKTLLEDEQWYVRNAAEEAFHEMERPDRGGILTHVDADKMQWLVEWAAERGEGVPAGPNSRQVLVRALQEGDAPRRSAAALALADLGYVPALKPLYGALRDREEEVRAAVYESLSLLEQRLGQLLPAVN